MKNKGIIITIIIALGILAGEVIISQNNCQKNSSQVCENGQIVSDVALCSNTITRSIVATRTPEQYNRLMQSFPSSEGIAACNYDLKENYDEPGVCEVLSINQDSSNNYIITCKCLVHL